MEQKKIWFTDFSDDVDFRELFLFKALFKNFDLILDEKHPDYLIYSCYSNNFLKYTNCVKIFFTAENIHPNFNLCDFALGFDYIHFDDRYLRYPNYLLSNMSQFRSIFNRSLVDEANLDSKYFCNFIYSNNNADPIRDNFFERISKYKFVHSLGGHLNNSDFLISGRNSSNWKDSKIETQKNFKFSIAIENSSTNGYTTEKIFQSFVANTIPIYYGNPLIEQEFNPKAFINLHNYKNLDDAIDFIKEIDNNDELYLDMINAPVFNNINLKKDSDNELISFFQKIFIKEKSDCVKRHKYGFVFSYEKRLKKMERTFEMRNKLLRVPAKVINKFKK